MASVFTSNEPPTEGRSFLRAPQELVANKTAKGPLELSFRNEATHLMLFTHIVRCIYANGLSFNVVRSPYWQKMVRSINEAPKGFKGPGYEVCTALLDREVINVEASMQPIKDFWIKTGVTIVSDGWKDARNRLLVNIIAVSTRGAMLLKAVDCEGEVKDGPLIANILIQAIEQVGP